MRVLVIVIGPSSTITSTASLTTSTNPTFEMFNELTRPDEGGATEVIVEENHGVEELCDLASTTVNENPLKASSLP